MTKVHGDPSEQIELRGESSGNGVRPVNLFEKCKDVERPRTAMAAGLYPYFHAIQESHGAAEVTINGRRMVMIGSNNYLGLTWHPKVREAAIQAIRDFGTGCSGSRFLNGTLRVHVELEERLAAFLGTEACLTFSTGFQTNLGCLSVIAGKNDIAFSDRENHSSILEGLRLSFARVRNYKHNDMEDLERFLADAPEDKGKLIVTDGVFSMLGDMVDLRRMKELADQYDARICLDDAHSVGVLGELGRGTSAHFGVDVDLITGTFSKSFASLGGFMAGPADVIFYTKHLSKPMIFSAAIPPSNAAAVLAALDVMETEPEHRLRLHEHCNYMRRELANLGYQVIPGESAIVPIHIGDDNLTFMTWKHLFERGVFTNAVVPPAVLPGQSLLRTSYMATHTREQLDRCLEVFGRVARDLKIAS